MGEQEALSLVGHCSDTQLKGIIARRNALSADDLFDAVVSSVSRLPDEEPSPTEIIYLQGEAAQVVLEIRAKQEEQRTREVEGQRRLASIRAVDVEVAKLRRAIAATRAALGHPHVDPMGPAHRALQAELHHHLQKLEGLQQRQKDFANAERTDEGTTDRNPD